MFIHLGRDLRGIGAEAQEFGSRAERAFVGVPKCKSAGIRQESGVQTRGRFLRNLESDFTRELQHEQSRRRRRRIHARRVSEARVVGVVVEVHDNPARNDRRLQQSEPIWRSAVQNRNALRGGRRGFPDHEKSPRRKKSIHSRRRRGEMNARVASRAGQNPRETESRTERVSVGVDVGEHAKRASLAQKISWRHRDSRRAARSTAEVSRREAPLRSGIRDRWTRRRESGASACGGASPAC